MSEDKVTRVKLTDRLEYQANKRGFEVELSDGAVLYVPPPELWTKEARAVLAKKGTTFEQWHRALVDGDVYDQYLAEGGTPELLEAMLREHYRATRGESSASSSS